MLGFFISRKVSLNFIEVGENFDLNFDHSALILILSERVIKTATRSVLIKETTNWKSFRMDLQEEINLNIYLSKIEDFENN